MASERHIRDDGDAGGQTDLHMPSADLAGRLSSREPAVRVTQLALGYGGNKVLRNVTFDLAPGKIYSIMGPSGCGKSTLLRCMIGAEQPDAGRVMIDGIEVWSGKRADMARARRKFGVLFQNSALLNDMTCGENVALPLRQHTDLSDSTIRMMVRLKLELVGMGEAIDRKPPELSGGMKKRCALARAIALDPAIVFYDEPSAGIDPVMIAVLDRLILDLSEKLGITSVVITHEMPSAFRVSDEMLMLWNGVVHFRGTPRDVRTSTDPVVRQFIHGDPEGPLSKARSKLAVSARVLGIPEHELEEEAKVRLEQARKRRENRDNSASNRFLAAERVMLTVNPDTRARRTLRLPKVGEPGADTGPVSGRFNRVSEGGEA